LIQRPPATSLILAIEAMPVQRGHGMVTT
jgi:hypothetical protein